MSNLLLEYAGGTTLLSPEMSQIIGRDEQLEIQVIHRKVSRHHAAVLFEDGLWKFKDLHSSNGSYSSGQLVSEVVIDSTFEVNLGDINGPKFVFKVINGALGVEQQTHKALPNLESSTTAPDAALDLSARYSLGARTQIGSGKSNDIRILQEDVSSVHAEIVLDKSGNYDLVSLSSSNPPEINGESVLRRQRLIAGDLISIGGETFCFVGSALESVTMKPQGQTLVVENLGLEIAGKTLLSDVSFQLKPGSLTAILGPSGAGKSTLMAAMTGRIPSAKGEVKFAGQDLRKSATKLAGTIGFVPQSDLLHTRLKTREAILFGAKLRFPKGTPNSQIQKRVDEVLAQLELTERANLRIDKLSGGQRKRASVALELLTEPTLLFLDEPTSGLDPGLDRQVMSLLRQLADSGKTVVVVTHSVSNLDLADDLILMAAGGRLGFFGSPKSVFSQMGTGDWAEIFERLSSLGSDAQRKAKPLRTIQAWNSLGDLPNPALQSWATQFMVLVKRYVKVIASDKGYLAFLGLLPFLIAGVGSLTGSKYGLDKGPEWRDYLNLEARPLMLVLILGAAFIGTSTSIQELVKERVIFAREKSVGLRVSAYIASKVLVLSAIVTAQISLFTFLTLAGRKIPAQGLVTDSALFEITGSLVILGLASLALGLLASSLVETSDVTMPILVALTMLQIVLSGAVPVSVDWLLQTLGPAIPAYWSMNMLAATVNLNELSYLESANFNSAWDSDATNWTSSAIMSLSMGVAVILVSGLIAKRARPGR